MDLISGTGQRWTHHEIVEGLLRDLLLEARLGFHVESGLLFETSRTGDAIAQLVPGAGGRIAICQEGEHTGGEGDLVDGLGALSG